MRIPKKTILAAALALMFAACGRSSQQALDDDKLSKKEWEDFRDSTMEVQLDSLWWWADSVTKVLELYNDRIHILARFHEVTFPIGPPDDRPWDGDDPPPVPCPRPPEYCPW